MKRFLITSVAVVAVIVTACNSPKPQAKEATVSESPAATNAPHDMAASSEDRTLKKGDVVPNDQVCMVNDNYMGKPQMEVVYNGKKYYGCCEMCKNRIPEEEEVRMAVDPVSKQRVDKALAVIAVTGDDGEVSYFENTKNYEAFFAKH